MRAGSATPALWLHMRIQPVHNAEQCWPHKQEELPLRQAEVRRIQAWAQPPRLDHGTPELIKHVYLQRDRPPGLSASAASNP